LRHGETEGSGTKRYHGSIDVPLSERGALQMLSRSTFIYEHLRSSRARHQTNYLRDIHKENALSTEDSGGETLSAVYCSDLRRSEKSAEIVAGRFALRPVIISDLRERGFGIWEGMSFLEIQETHPEEFALWASNPLKYSPPGGENTVQVKERVIRALDMLIGRHDGQKLAIVAHGGVNRIILCHILGVSLENIFRLEQDHAAVNVIEFWEKYPVVKLMNGGSQ